MAASPIYFGAVKNAKVQIVNADASGLKTVATGGANGSKVMGLVLTSDDTSARVIQVGITIGATFYLLGSVTVPIGAGTGAVISVNGFAGIPNLPMDNDGNKFIYLESGNKLEIKSETTVTAAKTVHANATQEDF